MHVLDRPQSRFEPEKTEFRKVSKSWLAKMLAPKLLHERSDPYVPPAGLPWPGRSCAWIKPNLLAKDRDNDKKTA